GRREALCRGGRRVSEQARLYSQARCGIRPSQRAAYDDRHRRSQSRRSRRTRGIPERLNMTTQMFDRIALIGIGLIGSSLARVIRREGLADHVVISTRSESTLARAEELGLGDSYTLDSAEAVKNADLVVVSVPVGSSGAVAKQIAGSLKPGAIVTDAGSTKCSVIAQMQPELPSAVHFIPGHPLAGTEYSGPDAGFADLFTSRWCILTPMDGTDIEATERL